MSCRIEVSNHTGFAARGNCRGRHVFNSLISIEEILVVRIVQRVELVLGADAAVQRLTVAPLLDVLQSAGDAAVARWC